MAAAPTGRWYPSLIDLEGRIIRSDGDADGTHYRGSGDTASFCCSIRRVPIGRGAARCVYQSCCSSQIARGLSPAILGRPWRTDHYGPDIAEQYRQAAGYV